MKQLGLSVISRMCEKRQQTYTYDSFYLMLN